VIAALASAMTQVHARLDVAQSTQSAQEDGEFSDDPAQSAKAIWLGGRRGFDATAPSQMP
jgi:hypothetical protein